MTEDNKCEKGTFGWLREQAKKDGFGDNIGGWQNWKNKKKREQEKRKKEQEREQEKRKKEQEREQEWYKELEDEYGKEFTDWAIKNKGHIPTWWINVGCKTATEYNNKLTQKKLKVQAKKDGFDDVDDWSKWKKDQNWHDYLKNRYGKDFADWAMKNKGHTPIWWISAGCKTQMEYVNKLTQKKLKVQAKKDGFDDVDDWSKWKKDQNWHDYLKNKYGKDFADWAMKNKDRVPSWWINVGCKTATEYNNKCAQDAGFKDSNERQREWMHETGRSIPCEFNEYCSSYVGVTIGEDIVGRPILDMMFEEIVKKEYGNPGYEFLCKNPRKEFLNRYPLFILEGRLERDKEYKVDVKIRHFLEGRQVYKIDYNNIADFFMIIGLGTMDDIPQFVLLIHKDEIIRGIKFWKRTGIGIDKSHYSEFKKYELKDELERFKELSIRKEQKEDDGDEMRS